MDNFQDNDTLNDIQRQFSKSETWPVDAFDEVCPMVSFVLRKDEGGFLLGIQKF